MKAEKVRSILEFGKSCKGLLGEESVGVTISTRRIKEALAEIDDLEARCERLEKEVERRGNLLEDVVNELDLSNAAITEHGPLGTEPAELVRLVLAEKDKRIAMLANGMTDILQAKPQKARE